MDLFLNELSLKEAGHPEIARQWMMNLMLVYQSAHSKGFRGLRMPLNIAGELIAPNYRVADWLSDSTVDQVIRSLFRNQANYPFTEDIFSQNSDRRNQLFEFKYKGRVVQGLGAACLIDSMAISLDNDVEWNNTSIRIHACYISEENNLIESEEDVCHCCKTDHLELLKEWIEIVNKPPIPDGKILWLKRKQFFPHIAFCRDIEDQVSWLHKNHPEFTQIKKRLFEIEAYCRDWETGPFDHRRFTSKLTPESEARLNQLKDCLTILCTDGTNRLFTWHFRYTPGAGRIYIYPDEEYKKIYVGYIGMKLKC